MKKILTVLLALSLIAGLLTGCATTKPSPGPQSGNSERETAPDFSYIDKSGSTVKLSDLRGKVVLIDFWATWCGPCRMTIPHVEAIYEKYKDKGVVVIGINLDEGDVKNVQQFIQAQGMNYLVVRDPNSQVAGLYGVNSIPRFFLIDKNGRIAKMFVGYDPNMEDVLSKEIDALLKE